MIWSKRLFPLALLLLLVAKRSMAEDPTEEEEELAATGDGMEGKKMPKIYVKTNCLGDTKWKRHNVQQVRLL